MTAILVIGGCQTQQGRQTFNAVPAKKPDRYTNAESLLSTEGYWDLIDEEQEDSPLAQHMKARVQVDPNQVKGRRKYISYKTPEEKTHFRTLRLASMNIVVPDKKPKRRKFMAAKSELINVSLKPKTKPVKKTESKLAQWRKKKNNKTKMAAVLGSGAIVKSIRLGEHPGKTRFVLDLTGPSVFDYELNNKKGYLLIDLPGTAWEANTKKIIPEHALLKGYSVRSNSKGTKILVALKKPGRLITSVSLLPNPTRGHRIYFDIGDAS